MLSTNAASSLLSFSQDRVGDVLVVDPAVPVGLQVQLQALELDALPVRHVRDPQRREVRVLDAGAGTGVLGLAAAEALVTRHGVRVHLVAVEQEAGALAVLRQRAAAVRARLGASALEVEIIAGDFLDLDPDPERRPLRGSAALSAFDYAIGNPPYFKMSPTDERGGVDKLR